jgi:hypothetical protein
MYLGAFQKPGTQRLLVAPRMFTPSDDALISHVVGNDLTYVFGDAVENATEIPPRYRDFTVDLSVVDQAIEFVLSR